MPCSMHITHCRLMEMLRAFIEWAAGCWASFQQYFALAMHLSRIQTGWAGGGVPEVPPSENSAASSSGFGRRLSTETETSTPAGATATEEAAGKLGQMCPKFEDVFSQVKKPSSITDFPEEVAEMLRRSCEAEGPVEDHKMRAELAFLCLGPCVQILPSPPSCTTGPPRTHRWRLRDAEHAVSSRRAEWNTHLLCCYRC